MLGFLDESLLQLEKGLTLAHRLGHTQSTIQAFAFAAEVHHIRRDPQQVEAFVTRVLPLLSEGGSAVAIANIMMLRAWAQVMAGEIENGLSIMREGLAAWRQTGSAFRVPERLARAAETYRLADRPGEAAALIAEALIEAMISGLRLSFTEFRVSCCSRWPPQSSRGSASKCCVVSAGAKCASAAAAGGE